MATLQLSASARWSPILKMLRPHARKARAGTCAWGCAGATAQHWPRSAWLHLLLCCEAWRLGDLVYGIGREGVSMARLCCGVGQPSRPLRPLRPIRSECRKYELSACLSLEQSRIQSSIPRVCLRENLGGSVEAGVQKRAKANSGDSPRIGIIAREPRKSPMRLGRCHLPGHPWISALSSMNSGLHGICRFLQPVATRLVGFLTRPACLSHYGLFASCWVA